MSLLVGENNSVISNSHFKFFPFFRLQVNESVYQHDWAGQTTRHLLPTRLLYLLTWHPFLHWSSSRPGSATGLVTGQGYHHRMAASIPSRAAQGRD